MADSGSSLAAALARDVQFINDDFYDEPGLGEALDEIIAAAWERLRLHRDEDGEWPAVLRAFVASELSYPRVATDAHERKAIALLDLIDSYMKATK